MDKELLDAFEHLAQLQETDLAFRAVGLYRAMFRHETDINRLDFHYADEILAYAVMGNEEALVDYKNYLQYLKCFSEKEYLSHKQMLEEELAREEEEE